MSHDVDWKGTQGSELTFSYPMGVREGHSSMDGGTSSGMLALTLVRQAAGRQQCTPWSSFSIERNGENNKRNQTKSTEQMSFQQQLEGMGRAKLCCCNLSITHCWIKVLIQFFKMRGKIERLSLQHDDANKNYSFDFRNMTWLNSQHWIIWLCHPGPMG